MRRHQLSVIMRVATFARCAGQRARTAPGPGIPSPPSKRLLRALSRLCDRPAPPRGALALSIRRTDPIAVMLPVASRRASVFWPVPPAGLRRCDPLLLPALAPISASNADAPRHADARSRIICHVSLASWQRTRAPSVASPPRVLRELRTREPARAHSAFDCLRHICTQISAPHTSARTDPGSPTHAS
jgi:hypothetical protein